MKTSSKSFVLWLVLAPTMTACAAGAQSQTAAPKPTFQTFEVATLKPVNPDHEEPGRYMRMESVDRFIMVNFTLRLMIAAAYDLNLKAISGGPSWADSAKFDLVAKTPGAVRPNRAEQMTMLRALLAERFGLQFHREPKVLSMYALEVAKGGPHLKPSTEGADAPPEVISTVFPDHVQLPARNVSMGDLVAMMQRALLDRPVVDKTGLEGRYDFDLTWAPDETQFQGEMPKTADDMTSPPLFTALKQQIGLQLEAMRGPVDTLVVDKAEKPRVD